MSAELDRRAAARLASDALGELFNVGAGHAADSLSRLLANTPISVGLPRVERRTAPADRLAPPAREVRVIVPMVVEGRQRRSARLAFRCTPEMALRIAHLMLPDAEADDTVAMSALLELANILASAFAGAAGALLGVVLMPGPPAVELGDMGLAGALDQVSVSTGFVGREGGIVARFALSLELGAALQLASLLGIDADELGD